MSFTDLLRQSRSKPVAALHKFLTNYDPNNLRRMYAFVEGDADKAFYKVHMQKHAASASDIYIYNCEGKSEVYDTFQKIIDRYPNCRRVLFFVDKDVDDIVGKLWPSDPRIYVTELYSIENYLVNRQVFERYFADYVKIRRVDVAFEQMSEEFDRQMVLFHRIARPIMAWVIAMRRAGRRVVLANIRMGELCSLTNSGTSRRHRSGLLPYLNRVTQTPESRAIWRNVRSVSGELQRLEAKRYVRGKFEAWWFVTFINRVIEQLVGVAREDGGSVTVSVQLSEKTWIQLLAGSIPTPKALDSFLEFHLDRGGTAQRKLNAGPISWVERLLRFIGIR